MKELYVKLESYYLFENEKEKEEKDFFKRLIIPNNQEVLRTSSSRLMYLYTNFNQSSSVSTTQPVLWYNGTFTDFNSIGSGEYQYIGINPIFSGMISLQLNAVADLYANCYYDIWVYKNGSPYKYVDRISYSGSVQNTSLLKALLYRCAFCECANLELSPERGCITTAYII